MIGLLALLALGATATADDTPERLLGRARAIEIQEKDYEKALALNERVLADPTLADDLRGTGHIGAGRCAAALARFELLELHIRGAEAVKASLKPKDREGLLKLTRQLDEHRSAAKIDEAASRRAQEALEAQRKKRLEEAQAFLEAGWVAFRRGAYDEARHNLWRASNLLGGETPETTRLYDALQSVQPDRGEVLRNLIEFFQTVQIRHYHQLVSEVEELYEAGKTQLGKQNYKDAGSLIVKAIQLIDESGFLGSAVGGTASLQQDRDRLVFWLRDIRQKAEAAGVQIPPEPTMPRSRGGGSDFAKQFYDLLASAFGTQGDGKYPLRFYEMVPPTSLSKPLVSSQFEGGLRVSQSDGTLSRAAWAEQWIRSNIPGKWDTEGRSAVARPGGRTSAPNTLVRFGDVVCVQHREPVHRRIETLNAWFPTKAIPLIADVHVLATTTAGIVAGSQALGAHASHRESGQDLLIKGRIVRECLGVLMDVDVDGRRMEYLGGAELHFEGRPTATLEITALTAEHPQFRGVSPPKLSIRGEDDARYGLWLEMYAEALPNVGRPPERNAFGVEATVRMPQGSVNVPKPDGDLPFTRLARMTEQHLSSSRDFPAFGTLMLVGMANPFPFTKTGNDQLVVLIGLRQQGEQTQDPPREGPTAVAPPDPRLIERSIGAIAAEVEDHLVPDGWPSQRLASSPPTLSVVRADRSRMLELLIAEGAALVERGSPPAELPSTVCGNSVSGVLSPENVARLDGFLDVLETHAADLYEVDLVTAVASRDRFDEWGRIEGASPLREGWVRLNRTAAQLIDRPMRADSGIGSLFNTARQKNARATQRIGFQKLAVEAIVRDQHVRRVGEDGVRYAAITGKVEEGLIVEVRPGLEQDGYRKVYVRARADRLKGIERMEYPGSDGDVFLEIPAWHGLEEAAGVNLMSDGDALLIAVPLPGSDDRVIAIKVSVRKVR